MSNVLLRRKNNYSPTTCARRSFNNDFKDSFAKTATPPSFHVPFSSSGLDSQTKKLLNENERPLPSISEYEDKARSVSHEVLDSLIMEGLKNKDYETVDLVLKEALELGKLSGVTMESSIRSCIDSGEYIHAWILFEAATRLDLIIGETVSNKIINHMIDQYFWIEASIAVEYSLKKGYATEKDKLLTILGGLIGSKGELDRALSILTVIADTRRDDLIAEFSTIKIEKLVTRDLRSTSEFPLLELLFSSLRRAMVQDAWWSGSLSRLAIALACVTENYQLAIDFTR
jgi:hypothetical protein